MWLGFRGRLGFAGLVDGDDPELVPLALAEAGHARLQLVYRRHAVLVVRDEGVEPAAELVFLLDDVVGDGAPTVVLRLLPPEGHRLVVEVDNVGLPGGARRS